MIKTMAELKRKSFSVTRPMVVVMQTDEQYKTWLGTVNLDKYIKAIGFSGGEYLPINRKAVRPDSYEEAENTYNTQDGICAFVSDRILYVTRSGQCVKIFLEKNGFKHSESMDVPFANGYRPIDYSKRQECEEALKAELEFELF